MLEFVVRVCSSVCHALPERTFAFGEHSLPLCARCVGVYLGFILTMIGFASTRLRSCKVVSGPLLWLNIFVIFLFAVFGFAGLYEALSLPNYFRLLIGMAFGAALAVFAFPLAHQWLLGMEAREWGKKDSFRFFALLIALLAVSLIVRQGVVFLFWPVVILAVMGLVGSHFLADLLVLSWILGPRRRWLGWVSVNALAALMCAGEFAFYTAWRRWWQVL